MEQIQDETMRTLLAELAESLHEIYGAKLKTVYLYGSVARGEQADDSDIDELRKYDEKLCDISTDISIKYLKVLSLVDVSYREYLDWKDISPFYRNVAKEGVVLYAA